MSLRKLAKLTGYIFIILGIMGYIPGLTVKGHLLGYFHVNSLHNIIHLGTGLIALGTAYRSSRAQKIFFQIAGIFYTAIGLFGFYYGNRFIFGLLANNLADSWLHFVLGISFLYLGFLYKNSKTT